MLLAALLAGCASVSPDGGMAEVARLTEARTGLAVPLEAAIGAPAPRVAELLAQPLQADDAVELALRNNAGLRAAFAAVGIAEADYAQAGRLPNPVLHFSRLVADGHVAIERSAGIDLVAWLTRGQRRDIEQARFEQARLQAAARAVALAGDTRSAYFVAVAAAQTAAYMEQVGLAAEASSELAQRMARVGNWSKLDEARERAFHAETLTQLVQARQQAVAAREALARLLGVWGAQNDFRLPERLPELPAQALDLPQAEAQAMAQRLDVQAAARALQAAQGALGLENHTSLVDSLELAYSGHSASHEAGAKGAEVSLALPLFDWGGARRARARASHQRAWHQAADTAVRARSQVRERYHAYRSAHDVARHYQDHIVPLRKRISEEMLLRYNGMLLSVFELLADAREQIASVNAAIEAQRDFWLADAQLQQAIHGGVSSEQEE
jgi:outer membrane protein TolC